MQTNERNDRQRAEALRSAAQTALAVQDAVNLSGVLTTFLEIVTNTLWPEARALNVGTTWVNTHPIVTLFLDKLSDLNDSERGESNASLLTWAWDRVKELARAHTADEHCTVDPDTELCSICGARHGMPCEECSGRAFHSPGCSRSDENSYVMEEDDPAAQKRLYTDDVLQAVTAALVEKGVDATWEYPGFIRVPVSAELFLAVGNEDGKIVINTQRADGDSVDSDVPDWDNLQALAESEEVEAIADHIAFHAAAAAQRRSAEDVASEHDETRFLERIKLLSRNVGSISHATMREEDLIPKFAGALLDQGKLLRPEHKALGERAGVLYDRLESAVEAGEEAFWEVVAERFPEATAGDLESGTSAHLSTAMEEAVKEWVGLNVQEPQELVVKLIDALDAYAPEGFYFGAHPGDGSDYGFWMHEDFLERCAEDDIPVFDDSSEAPDDIQGPYVVISDHGNVSFYFAGRSETVTQWAVV